MLDHNKKVITMNDCEFCREFNDPRHSRFFKIYGNLISSRIVCETNNFVCLPTIGQLFFGSYLILPTLHYERVCELESTLLEELLEIIYNIRKLVSKVGYPLLFEHGAKCCTNHGCGIYHAHVHIIPTPHPVSLKDVLPDAFERSSDPVEAFSCVSNSSSYMFCQDHKGDFGYAMQEDNNVDFGSQYIRKRLVNIFNLKKHWDWKSYAKYEPIMLDAINFASRELYTWRRENAS